MIEKRIATRSRQVVAGATLPMKSSAWSLSEWTTSKPPTHGNWEPCPFIRSTVKPNAQQRNTTGGTPSKSIKHVCIRLTLILSKVVRCRGRFAEGSMAQSTVRTKSKRGDHSHTHTRLQQCIAHTAACSHKVKAHGITNDGC